MRKIHGIVVKSAAPECLIQLNAIAITQMRLLAGISRVAKPGGLDTLKEIKL